MSLVINHPLFGRGRLESSNAPDAVNAGAAADLIGGDGARVRLIVTAAFAATVDPETVVRVSDATDGTSGALCALTPTNPTVVMRYEEYGDLIQRPLRVSAVAAGVAVTARPIRWRPEGGG